MLRGCPARRAEAVALACILLVAVASRVLLLQHENLVFPDEGSYLELAQNLEDGRGFVSDVKWHFWDDEVTHPEDNRQPAVPVVLALVQRVVPDSHLRASGQALMFVIGLVLVVATWALGRLLFGALAGLAAALFVAVHHETARYSVIVMTEIPFALALVVIAILLHPDRRPSPRRLAALGAVLGLAYLTRSNGAWQVPVVVFALALGPRPSRWWHWAIPFAVALLVVAPWLVRNERELGDAFLTGGSMQYFVEEAADLSAASERPTLSAYLRDHGIGDMVSRFADNLPVAARHWTPAATLVLWLLAAAGLVLTPWRRQLYAWLSALVGFAGVVWIAIQWGVQRLHVPYIPLLAVLAAGTCAALHQRGGRWRPVGIALAGVAVAVPLSQYPKLVFEPYYSDYERTLQAMTDAVERLPPDVIVAERYGFPFLGFRIYEHRHRVVMLNWTPPDELVETGRRYGARYLVVPSDLPGAEHERALVDTLPLVRRGPGWELRSLEARPQATVGSTDGSTTARAP